MRVKFKFILFLFFAVPLFGASVKPYDKGLIHEGFLSKTADSVLLDSAPRRPPEPINERIPKQIDMQAEWLPGYWSWVEDMGDFVWVSGVWRRPPPGHSWIIGFWKNYDGVWAWIPGFWSKVPPQSFTYIDVPPPDAIDEDMPPSPGDNYFWAPGYWFYIHEIRDYRWVPGHWEELDPDWVLVPARYVWQPNGYVFVPAYWDWPLDIMGTAYYPVIIEAGWRGEIIYGPDMVFEPAIIIEHIFPFYPDYLCFFHHHFHFHADFWRGFCCVPPWWGWNAWWGFSWHDHWGLWWWFAHPGFPQPFWLDISLAAMISPPSFALFAMFEGLLPPPFVLKEGVVPVSYLLDAAKKVTGKNIPLLPGDKKVRDRILNIAASEARKVKKIIRPSGKRLPVDPSIRKPQVKKPFVGRNIAEKNILQPRLSPALPAKPKLPGAGRVRDRDVRQLRPPIREPRQTRGRYPDYKPHDRLEIEPPRIYPERRVPSYEPPVRTPRYRYPGRSMPERKRPEYRQPRGRIPRTEIPHNPSRGGGYEIEVPNRLFPPDFKRVFGDKQPEIYRPHRKEREDFGVPEIEPPARYQPEIKRERLPAETEAPEVRDMLF